MATTIDIVAAETEYGEIVCGGCGSGDLQFETLDILARRNPAGPWFVRCTECRATNEVTTAQVSAATETYDDKLGRELNED